MSQIDKILEMIAQQIKYGQLDLNLDVHDGKLKSIVGSEHAQLNYPGDGTQKSVEDLLASLALERNQKRTGKVTYTFDLHTGSVKRLYIHKQIKHSLTGQ